MKIRKNALSQFIKYHKNKQVLNIFNQMLSKITVSAKQNF